jgi:antitoxin component of RelBE/YafQ-DinJ toxin-antitoxin module
LTSIIRLYILLDMDTTMLIKTKKDLKLQAQALASDLGFSLTDIVNASLRQFVINQGMTISKIPTESLDMYSNKKEILSAYQASLKEF